MKINTALKLKSLLLAFTVLLFSSCHNWFDDETEPEYEYLVDYTTYRTYPFLILETIFDEWVSENPDMAFLQERIEHGVTICKVYYNTTFQGEPIVASGLACFPMGDGTFPLISFQNGTNTEHEKAPTENPDDLFFQMLESVASAGFVISLPDYLGFGASAEDTFHPYMHKESTVQSVVDMLRAVKELADHELNVAINNDLYITGYSQGGWATMQLQKALEGSYAGEFNLKASACGAGPYDLAYINEYILEQATYPMPYFVGYIFHSYMNLNAMSTPVDSVFNDPYASRIPGLYDGSKSGEEINEKLTTQVNALFRENYRENYLTDTTFNSLRAALEENSIDAWATNTPTMIFHGTEDKFVPYQVSENIYNDFQSTGIPASRVVLQPLEGKGHTTGILPAGLASIEWILEMAD